MRDHTRDSSRDSVECPERPSTPPPREAPSPKSPISPPTHVIRRLTPLGRYSSGNVEDDLQEHQRRRHSHLQAKITRLSMHSTEVSRRADRTRRERERKRDEFHLKLERAIEQRQRYLERKRSIAAATLKSLETANAPSASSATVLPETPMTRADFAKSRTSFVSEITHFASSLTVANDTTFADIRDGLRRLSLFGSFSTSIKSADLRSSFKLLVAVPILKALALFFKELHLQHSPLFMARSFLYALTMIVEKDYQSHIKRTPTYMVLLENAEQDTVYHTLCQDHGAVRKRFLDNYYYKYLIRTLLAEASGLWKQFECILASDTASTSDFSTNFKSFIQHFQAFRYMHLVRSIASLIESNMQLSSHMDYLETMKGLTDSPLITSHYQATILECRHSIESNAKSEEDFTQQLEKITNLTTILNIEKALYVDYEVDVLSKSVLKEYNPLICRTYSMDTASVSSVFTTSRFCGLPVSMIPPTFSTIEWRRIMLHAYLEYRSSLATNGKNFNFLRTGRRGSISRMHSSRYQVSSKTLFTPASALGNEIGFLDYVNYTFQPDVESSREWLGLETFSEGCMEALELFSGLDNVEDMMVDIAQMVEKSLYALRVVAQNQHGKLVIAENCDTGMVAVLSDAVQVIERIRNGKLPLLDYFVSVLGVFQGQLPDFLQEECGKLIKECNESITKTFVEHFVELTTDCMIFSVNKAIREGLNFVGSRVLEFEGELLETVHCSQDASLDLRYPQLYSEMTRRPPHRGEEEALDEEVYEIFNTMLMDMLTGSERLPDEADMPEIFETFMPQIRSFYNEAQGAIVLQSLSVLLGMYLGPERRKSIDFGGLLLQLDAFIRDYFAQSSSCRLDNAFKDSVLGILNESIKQSGDAISREIDAEAVFGLIDQVAKCKIGSTGAHSVRSVYAKTLRGILSMYSAASVADTARYNSMLSRFSAGSFLRERIEKLIGDYYLVFDCLYETYWNTLRGCCTEYEIMAH